MYTVYIYYLKWLPYIIENYLKHYKDMNNLKHKLSIWTVKKSWMFLIQLALHIHWFCIHKFNQPQIKNTWGEKVTWFCWLAIIQKKKVDTCTVFLFLLPKQYCVASSDIVLEITSNLGINLSIQEDVHILHANTMPFYVRPEHPWILESSGVPEPPPWLLRNNCIGVLYL